MCGILIAYGTRQVEPIRFDAARDTLIHRGPDAQQSVYLNNRRLALGHTRLSIIDLSSRANQPMQSGNLWVTFNGEIYNYLELRRELETHGCQFVTSSDTEVLLHGYRVWGEELCSRLLGMFAFAIWDDQSRRLFLARDHFGQKPLYFTEIGGQFVAASEIKAIKAYTGHTFRLRRESIVDAMVQDFVAEPNTWYEDIQALSAGHQMTVTLTEAGVVSRVARNFWSFVPDPDPVPVTEAQALEGLTAELDHAIRSHLLADVEVGAFLSGGIDSTCIATLASKMLSSRIQTFSIGFGGNDELPLARETATRINALHHEGIVTEQDYQSFEGRALQLFDFPFADTSIVPTEYVSMLAARKVRVVLTGDGGDESFGGYDYGRMFAPDLVPKPAFERTARGVRNLMTRQVDLCGWKVLGAERWARIARARLIQSRQVSRWRRSVLAPALLADLKEYDPAAAYSRHRNGDLPGFREAQWIGIKVALPSRMLVKVDRCSMAHSLETRAPFLSPRLVEFMLSLPVSITNPEGNWYKGLLRTWLDGKIAPSVLRAKKRGFDLPGTWTGVDLRAGGASCEQLPNCVSAGLIRPGRWRKLQSAPRTLWYLKQIEKSLATGQMKC